MTTNTKNPLRFYRDIVILSLLTMGELILLTPTVFAKDLYVQPFTEIVVRRGKGTDYKIISMVKSGSKVEFIEGDESYTLVRLPNGKEGWMLTRFLSDDPPLELVVENLSTEKEALQDQLTVAREKIEELSNGLKTTQYELDVASENGSKLQQSYDTLLQDTADVVQIKTDLEKTTEENAVLSRKLAEIEGKYSKVKKDDRFNWFLAGAGVLVLGIILGRLPSPSRRRRSSLLS